MPRVQKRKARKDYPAQGIKKGDTYYYTRLRLQRGGMVKRSLTPFKPSQLTNSPFKSAFLAAGEEWAESDRDADAIRNVAEAIREVGQDAQENFDNMPEGLQEGDTGQMLYERAEQCESKADELESLADEWDQLEEPEEPQEPEGGMPDDDEAPDFAAKTDAWETYLDEKQQYDEDMQAFEEEQERILSEVDELVEDMPE